MTKEKKFGKDFHITMIPVYLLAGYILFGVIKRHYFFSNDRIEKKYTIGKIYKIDPGAKTPPSFEYEFVVDNKKFDGSKLVEGEMAWIGLSRLKEKFIGKKFLVKFIERNPNYSELIIDKPFKDSSLVIPKSGWGKIPF